MRFLVDAQLPPALARWLVAAGHEAEHVADRGMQAASDKEIWDLAVRERAAIITKDEDFAQRHALAATSSAIVWIRLRNTRNPDFPEAPAGPICVICGICGFTLFFTSIGT